MARPSQATPTATEAKEASALKKRFERRVRLSWRALFAEEGEHQEGADHDERPQQTLREALGEQRKPAQAHAALEALLERASLFRFRGGGCCLGRSCHARSYLACLLYTYPSPR